MPDFLSRLHTLPRTFVMDSGGENVSKEFLKFCYKYAIKPRYTTKDQHEQNLTERKNQSLRDTAMTMLASAGMSPIYWSYAIVYAAFIDQFVPDINGTPPYLYWHERLPERVSLPLFGADLVVRQMEDSAQQQFSPPGTHCKFLGLDPKSNAAFVVHMDSDGMPVRRTTEILLVTTPTLVPRVRSRVQYRPRQHGNACGLRVSHREQARVRERQSGSDRTVRLLDDRRRSVRPGNVARRTEIYVWTSQVSAPKR